MENKVDKRLIEKWSPILNATGRGTPALAEEQKPGMAQLLENQEKWLKENENDTGNLGLFTPIMVPMARRIGPGLVANQIVGVQPMSGPTGFAYAWRSYYSGTGENKMAPAVNPLHRDGGVSGTGYTNAQSKTGPTFKSVIYALDSVSAATLYSTSSTTGTVSANGKNEFGTVKYIDTTNNLVLVELSVVGTAAAVGDDVQFAATFTASAADATVASVFTNETQFNYILPYYSGPMTTAAGEVLGDDASGEDHFPSMGVTMERAAVVAQTRKLKAEYTVEMAQDLKAMHALDAEAELMNVMQYEIAAEIDRSLVAEINGAATAAGAWNYLGFNPSNPGTSTSPLVGTGIVYSDGNWEQEKFRTLYTKIVKEANLISVATRRGPGNYVLVSPNVVSALEGLNNFMYSQVGSDLGSVGGVTRAGTLDGRFAVYVDTFARTDYATVGFKGPGNLDTGVIYCPYIPVMTQKVVHEKTFQPAIGMMTRDAILYNMNGTGQYYRKFSTDFTGSQLGYQVNAPVLG